MNRIEWIIKKVQDKIDNYKERYPEKTEKDRWVIPRWEEQLKFYRWLLEEADGPPSYELHDPRVEPTRARASPICLHLEHLSSRI